MQKPLQIVKEFRTFALRGNVVDLAIGIIIGAAFNNIVKSLVDDVVMPPIGYLLRRVDFSNLYVNLGGGNFGSLAEAKQAGAPTINYGLFINALISFVITAIAVFILVRIINRLREKEDVAGKKAEEKASEAKKTCPYCKNEVLLGATRCQFCTSELK